MNYTEAKEYLKTIEQSQGWVFGLDTMRELLSRLGDPQNDLKFIHIAGTNGKGSVLAFLSTILETAGYRVGRYVSPRVFNEEEFIQINREMISRGDLCVCVSEVQSVCQAMLDDGFPQPTLFEVETAIGFLYFKRNSCDIVALECGLGGRDDATNVITTAVVCILTAIGLDHMEYLGSTIYEIAESKAGIIKSKIPAVTGKQDAEALKAIEERCSAVDSVLYRAYPEDLTVKEGLQEEKGIPCLTFDYRHLENLKIRLLGRYQAENAALAVEAAFLLSQNGYPLTEEQIRKGLFDTTWPGRFEMICSKPEIILDGAHNPPAAKKLRESVDYYFGNDHVIYVMGMLADKDYQKVVEITCGAASQVITLTPDNPRALPAQILAETVRALGIQAFVADSYEDAAVKALQAAGTDGVIIVFGSLSFLCRVSEILKNLIETNKENNDSNIRDLSSVRAELDILDGQLIHLFEHRMELSEQVARYKISKVEPVRDMNREQEKIDNARALVSTEFNKNAVEELMCQIMAISRKRQYQLMDENDRGIRLPFRLIDHLDKTDVCIVYQGVPGAYAHMAVMQYFGSDFNGFHVKNWEDAMNALSGGRADYAVLPIENSTAGIVGDVYDLLAKYDNYIVGETSVRVDHALLGLPGATMESISRVYSHPQGLAQCQKFLNEHKTWHQITVENTAVGAKRVVSEGDPSHAAIASSLSAQLYGLDILKCPLNHNSVNTTRFVIISNQKVFTRDAQKISICFEAAHESGSLYNILSHFIFNGLNMFHIESRPVPGATWEYRFFVDFTGNLGDSGVRNALTGISEEAVSLKILGNY